ncbi:uncharacterized protein TNCV_4586071 [Trichonephila clavipes]|nr:uncharacterized protein TNCV_4586071 [Trichonephila clavipes]
MSSSTHMSRAVGSLVVRASDSSPEGLGSMLDVTKYPPSAHGFTCRNCGGGDRGRVAIYRPFGEVSLSLNRTVTYMVLKANDRRTSCPCHDESRGPRSDYVRQKNVKSGKGPLTPAGLLKLVKRFEETGKLEDRARAGRPCLKEARAPCIAVETEAIASEAASGTSSAREAARRLGLPPSSVRNILRRILQLYPHKLQSCHELLPADTAQREAFVKWAFSKMEQDSTWVFNILWTDEAHFPLHGDVYNHNVAFG